MSACAAVPFNFSFAALAALVATLGTVLLTFGVLRRRDFPGAGAFLGAELASALWIVAGTAEAMAGGWQCKQLIAQHTWPFILATPTLWALCLWRYTSGRTAAIPLPLRALMALMPVGFWAVAASNGWHHLVYTEATGPQSSAPGAAVDYVHGPAFWVATAYVYAGMALSLAIVLRAARAGHGAVRRLHLSLVGLTLVPLAVNASYVFGGLRLWGVDPTPFSFAVTPVLFAWAVKAHALFDLVPVARGALVDALPDPVIVVDGRGRVVDTNPPARALHARTDPTLPLHDGTWLGSGLRAAIAAGGQGVEVKLPGAIYDVTCVPLRREGTCVGTLVYLRDVTARHASEQRLSDMVDRVHDLHDRLREQAMRDPLTGLLNRSSLAEFFQRACTAAAAAGETVAIALVDLDHFKSVNDRHGHGVGDEVLRQVSERLKRVTRASDGLFRIGGEEFLVVLPGATADQERLALLAETVAQEPVHTAAGPLRCTLSAGVAEWPAHGDDLQAVMRAADRALYRAKAHGRNRVLLAEAA